MDHQADQELPLICNLDVVETPESYLPSPVHCFGEEVNFWRKLSQLNISLYLSRPPRQQSGKLVP